MKTLKYIWAIGKNLVVLWLIMSIYDAVSGEFGTIVVSGLLLIYLQSIWATTLGARAAIESTLLLHQQFHEIKALMGKDEENYREEIRQAKELYTSKNIEFWINVSFACLFFLIAVINILNSINGNSLSF